ncbi:type II restriction endonuclease [Luteimonas sp. YGD11-2]|uniref:type II restriction endonuclease n=1 Tax=Luteimonas sp. YGD11-2 TaxID=2508168 RepID=UPI0019D71BAC|nr:type II restriction endonuclease [Luteimonas sp. YGD11-2]
MAEEAADGSPLWWKIQALVNDSDQLLVKKLSRNDTSWADDRGMHQAGLYIPTELRQSGFFPPLEATNSEKPHIFVAGLDVLWPQTGEVTRSNLRHYSNKGAETHLTRLPRPLFRELTPASLFLAGRLVRPVGSCRWWAVILDSAGEEAELLETVLDLGVDFHHAIFAADRFAAAHRADQDELERLIEQFRSAIRNGTLHELAATYSLIPDPATIATQARNEWLQANGRESFDPWQISTPGDAIMKISREIEYQLYRAHELKRRASELLTILVGGADLASTVVRRYPDIDAVLLSASQQRKTRAGRSFEHHIAAALTAGNVRFQEQAVTGGRRPDFVLPDLATLRQKKRERSAALVLAAKTTLRERWKQVSSEQLNCDVYLATVDDRVTAASIREMAGLGIRLVVPEMLKNSDEAFYKGQESVLSFREFFDRAIRDERPALVEQIPR